MSIFIAPYAVCSCACLRGGAGVYEVNCARQKNWFMTFYFPRMEGVNLYHLQTSNHYSEHCLKENKQKNRQTKEGITTEE